MLLLAGSVGVFYVSLCMGSRCWCWKATSHRNERWSVFLIV